MLTRDEIAEKYLAQIPYTLYPVQEDALLAWFSAEQGVMVCAPTGTGKTLIAEAAIFEALHSGKKAYYTTPLIALTDQKFRELQAAAVKWGFQATDIGLVTGNHRVNPDARILVVVAEILFNRLMHGEFDFADVQSVVMDEFHSFNDPERGIVWEFSLGLLPESVRLLLLSATVGNAGQFANWLKHEHRHDLELVVSEERKVPLSFMWVGDQLLPEHLPWMCLGGEEQRFTPALIFCFNREECWRIADEIKGKELITTESRSRIMAELGKYDWSEGAGPRIKQLLIRGVGIHHAGIMPKYRRIVEELFQQKLLAFATCTETLSAGINLPARSVVLPSIMKGPVGKQFLLESGTAQQIFGRAGRPQFDSQGYVFALAHEDDVQILRWKEKFDRLPENSKEPSVLAEKKALKRKQPKRNPALQYWSEAQFMKLKTSPAANLESRGSIPWRLLAYMLTASDDVELLRKLVRKRLLFGKKAEDAQKDLERQLATLWSVGFIRLEPEPPEAWFPKVKRPVWETAAENVAQRSDRIEVVSDSPVLSGHCANALFPAAARQKKMTVKIIDGVAVVTQENTDDDADELPIYIPHRAIASPALSRMTQLRGVNPLYGLFLAEYLPHADREERIQALESLLELPFSLGPAIRVPTQDDLPPGELARGFLDERLLSLGLAVPEELVEQTKEEWKKRRDLMLEPIFAITLAEKLERLFRYEYPLAGELKITPVWVVGELLRCSGKFNQYITAKSLQKQEGMIFRHVLRFILLLGEFRELTLDLPEEEVSQWKNELQEIGTVLTEIAQWQNEFQEIGTALTEMCEKIDPAETRLVLEEGL